MGNVHGGIYRMSGSGNYPYYDARFDPTNPSDHHREFKEEYPRRKRPTNFLGSLEKVPDSQISLIENERRRSSGLEPLPSRRQRSFRGQGGLAQRQGHSYHEEEVETRRRSTLTEERMSSRGGDLNNSENRRKSFMENERGGPGSRSYDGGVLKSGSNSTKVDEGDRYDIIRKRYAERINPNKRMPSKIGGSSENRRSIHRDDEDFKKAQSQRDQDDQRTSNSLKGVGVTGFDDLSQADKDFAKEWNTPDFFQRLDSLTFNQNQRKRSCWDDIGLSPGCLDGLPCSSWRTERGFFGGISCICNNNRRTWIPPWETPLEPICPHLMESVDRMIDSWREEEELQRRRSYPSNDFNELLVGSEGTLPRAKYARANPDFKRKSKPNLPRTNSAGSLDQNSTPSMKDLSTKGSTKSQHVGPIIPRRKSTDPGLRESSSNPSRDAKRSQRSKKLIKKGEGPEMTLSERPKITSFRDTPGEIQGSKYPSEKQWQKSPSKIIEPGQEISRFFDEDPIPYSKSSSRFPEMPNSISHSSSSSQDTPIPEQDVNVRVPKAYQWPEWHPASTNAPGEPGEPGSAQGPSKNPGVSEPETKLKSYPWPIWHPLSQTRASQSGAPPDLKSARESSSKQILPDRNGSFKQGESSPDQKKSIQKPHQSPGRLLEPFEREAYPPELKSGQFTPSGSAINSENDLINPRSQEYPSIPYSGTRSKPTQADQAEKSPNSSKVNGSSKRDLSIPALQPKEVLYASPKSKYGPKSRTSNEEPVESPREALPKKMRSGHFPDLRNLFEEPINGDSRDTPIQRHSEAPFQSEPFKPSQNGKFQGYGGRNALSSREVDPLGSNLKPGDLVSPSFKSKESLEPPSSKKKIPGQRDQSKGSRDQLNPDQIKKPSGAPFEPRIQSGISPRRSGSSKFIPKQDPVRRTSRSQDPIPEGYSGPYQEDQIESPMKGSSEQGSSPTKSPPSLETPPEFKWRSVRPVPEHFHPDPESLYKPKAHSEDSRREFEPFNWHRGNEDSPKSEHTSQKPIEEHNEPQGTQLTNIPPSRGISKEERLKLFPGRVPTQDQLPSEPSFQKRGSPGSEYLSKSSLRPERSSQIPSKSNYGPQIPSSLEMLPVPSSQHSLQGKQLKSLFSEERNQFQEDTTVGRQDIEQKRKRTPSASKFQSEERPKTSILRPGDLSASPRGEKSRDIRISGMPHSPNSPKESQKQFQGSEIGGRRGFGIPSNQIDLPGPSQRGVSSKNLPESRVWSEFPPNQEEQIGYTPISQEIQSRTPLENKHQFEEPQGRSLTSFEPKEHPGGQSWPESSLKSSPIEDQLVQKENIPERIKSRSEISKSSLRSRNLHQFDPRGEERQPQKTHSSPVNQEELSWLFPNQRSQAEPIKINPLGSKELSQIPRPIKDERVVQHRMVQPELMPGETSLRDSSIGENSHFISHPSREPIKDERPKTSFEPRKPSTKNQMEMEKIPGNLQSLREWSEPSPNQGSPVSSTPDRRASKDDRLRLFPKNLRQLEEPTHGEKLSESPFKKEQQLRGFSGSKSNLRPEKSSQMLPKYGPQPPNMQRSTRIPSDLQTYQEQPLESPFPNVRDQSRGARTERKQSPQHMPTIPPSQSEERHQISFRSKEIQTSPNQIPPREYLYSQRREYPGTSSNQNNFVQSSGIDQTQSFGGQNEIPPSHKGLPSPQFQSPGQFRFSSRSREDLGPSQGQKEPGKTFSGLEGHTESSRRSGSSKIPIRSRPKEEGPIEKSISPHLNQNQSEIKRSGLSPRNQHQFKAPGTQSGISTKSPPSSFQTREQPRAFATYSGLGQRDNFQSNKLEKNLPRFPSQNVPHSPNIQPKDSRTPAKLKDSSKEPSFPSRRKGNQSGYSPEGIQRSEPSPSSKYSSLPRPTQDYNRSEHSGHPQPIQMHQESYGGPLSRQINQAQAPPRSNLPSGFDFQPRDQLRSHNLAQGPSELPKNSKTQGLIPRGSHLPNQSLPKTLPGQANAPPKQIHLEPTPQTSKNGKDLTKTRNPKSKPDGQTRMKFGSISRSYTPTFDDHVDGCLSPISLSNPSHQTSSSCFSPPRCEFPFPSNTSNTLPKCPDSQ